MNMREFWGSIREEVSSIDPINKANMLPSLKTNEVHEVMKMEQPFNFSKKINDDAVFAMTKAAELLILELTQQSWQSIVDGDRHNLRKEDIKHALSVGGKFDLFLDMLDD